MRKSLGSVVGIMAQHDFGHGHQTSSLAAECSRVTWKVVTLKHMEAALKPTGDWPGGHLISKDGLLPLLSPTSRKEFRIDPALHWGISYWIGCQHCHQGRWQKCKQFRV